MCVIQTKNNKKVFSNGHVILMLKNNKMIQYIHVFITLNVFRLIFIITNGWLVGFIQNGFFHSYDCFYAPSCVFCYFLNLPPYNVGI